MVLGNFQGSQDSFKDLDRTPFYVTRMSQLRYLFSQVSAMSILQTSLKQRISYTLLRLHRASHAVSPEHGTPQYSCMHKSEITRLIRTHRAIQWEPEVTK